jgi:hypothetical protein
MSFTVNQNLEELTGASNPDETYNENLDNLDIGRLVPVAEYGEAVTQYQPAFIKDADDKCYISDANTAADCFCHGLVSATADSGADGFLYGAGAIVTNVAWNWALNSWVFVADDKTLSQTPGTVPLPVGYPIAPTKLLVCPGRMALEQAHITDAKTDYTTGDLDSEAEVIAAVNATNTAINSILVRLEQAGINLTA